MRIIVAGGRDFNDYELLCIEVSTFIRNIASKPTIVSGTAKGADKMGETYAKARNINLREFPADWDRFGKAAGFIRNEEMADYSDALIAFWDGKSKGTKHMINTAIDKGLFMKVIKY